MDREAPENRILAALGYPIWVVALVVVLTEMKKDPFLRHHGWQALFWGIGWFVLWVGLNVATALLAIVPLLGIVIRFLAGLAFLTAWGLLSVVYAVRAYRGERFEIPVVVNFARRYMLGEV
jgi:uncharacterized membrane protein